jgi:hypothetical protein
MKVINPNIFKAGNRPRTKPREYGIGERSRGACGRLLRNLSERLFDRSRKSLGRIISQFVQVIANLENDVASRGRP